MTRLDASTSIACSSVRAGASPMAISAFRPGGVSSPCAIPLRTSSVSHEVFEERSDRSLDGMAPPTWPGRDRRVGHGVELDEQLDEHVITRREVQIRGGRRHARALRQGTHADSVVTALTSKFPGSVEKTPPGGGLCP